MLHFQSHSATWKESEGRLVHEVCSLTFLSKFLNSKALQLKGSQEPYFEMTPYHRYLQLHCAVGNESALIWSDFEQFIAGLGLGSASLVRHVSGWTLTSISGFSSAFSRVLQQSLSAQAAARCEHLD